MNQCEEKWVIRVTEACDLLPVPGYFSLNIFKSRCYQLSSLSIKALNKMPMENPETCKFCSLQNVLGKLNRLPAFQGCQLQTRALLDP